MTGLQNHGPLGDVWRSDGSLRGLPLARPTVPNAFHLHQFAP